jgi:hypothetical protein
MASPPGYNEVIENTSSGEPDMNRPIFLLATALGLCGIWNVGRADSIELVNGDLLHGKVVSLDDVELRLISDIHGAVIIARDKVAAIGFGERKLVQPAAPAVPDGTPDAQGVVRRSVTVGDQSQVTATVPIAPSASQDVIRQLRAQGLTPANIAELQKALPMLKEPGARQYFDEKVKGLTEGTMNVEGIRKEAIRARDEFRKTAKSLGPDGEKAMNQTFGGWIEILDRFIREADPNAAKPPVTPSEKTKPDGTRPQQSKPEAAKSPTITDPPVPETGEQPR